MRAGFFNESADSGVQLPRAVPIGDIAADKEVRSRGILWLPERHSFQA